MIEEEFLRIQEGPEDVFKGFFFGGESFLILFPSRLFGEVILRELHLGGVRVAAEGDVIDVGDFVVLRAGIFGHAISTTIGTSELVLDVGGIQQMQALGEAGFLCALALAGR